MVSKKDIEHLKNIALSDKDVLDLVEGKATIMLYSDLHKYKTLDDVLKPYGAIFLLYEIKKDYGHWCAVFKQDNDTVEFFDPYGKFLDTELEWIPTQFRKISNQWYPHLTALFYHSPYKNLIYNQYPFQKKGNNVKTCGRWSALRIMFRDLPLDDFASLFLGKKSDDLVTLFTSLDLKY